MQVLDCAVMTFKFYCHSNKTQEKPEQKTHICCAILEEADEKKQIRVNSSGCCTPLWHV